MAAYPPPPFGTAVPCPHFGFSFATLYRARLFTINVDDLGPEPNSSKFKALSTVHVLTAPRVCTWKKPYFDAGYCFYHTWFLGFHIREQQVAGKKWAVDVPHTRPSAESHNCKVWVAKTVGKLACKLARTRRSNDCPVCCCP